MATTDDFSTVSVRSLKGCVTYEETPQGGCFARDIPNREQTWRRSWVATIRWHYPEGSEAANSASLASSIIFLGRTVEGWKVYYQFH